jgi:hypothetical protein
VEVTGQQKDSPKQSSLLGTGEVRELILTLLMHPTPPRPRLFRAAIRSTPPRPQKVQPPNPTSTRLQPQPRQIQANIAGRDESNNRTRRQAMFSVSRTFNELRPGRIDMYE